MTSPKKPATRGPKKMSALRGPKLFGKVMPIYHSDRVTEWEIVGLAWVQLRDMGPAWSCSMSIDGMVSQRGTGFSTAANAQRGAERMLKRMGKALLALGWEPKR